MRTRSVGVPPMPKPGRLSSWEGRGGSPTGRARMSTTGCIARRRGGCFASGRRTPRRCGWWETSPNGGCCRVSSSIAFRGRTSGNRSSPRGRSATCSSTGWKSIGARAAANGFPPMPAGSCRILRRTSSAHRSGSLRNPMSGSIPRPGRGSRRGSTRRMSAWRARRARSPRTRNSGTTSCRAFARPDTLSSS